MENFDILFAAYFRLRLHKHWMSWAVWLLFWAPPFLSLTRSELPFPLVLEYVLKTGVERRAQRSKQTVTTNAARRLVTGAVVLMFHFVGFSVLLLAFPIQRPGLCCYLFHSAVSTFNASPCCGIHAVTFLVCCHCCDALSFSLPWYCFPPPCRIGAFCVFLLLSYSALSTLLDVADLFFGLVSFSLQISWHHWILSLPILVTVVVEVTVGAAVLSSFLSIQGVALSFSVVLLHLAFVYIIAVLCFSLSIYCFFVDEQSKALRKEFVFFEVPCKVHFFV